MVHFVSQEDPALCRFPFMWERNPAFLQTWEIKILSIEESQFIFFLSCEENLSLQTTQKGLHEKSEQFFSLAWIPLDAQMDPCGKRRFEFCNLMWELGKLWA